MKNKLDPDDDLHYITTFKKLKQVTIRKEIRQKKFWMT